MNLQFELPNAANGILFSLDSFPGAKAVVVVFTCNHCPYAVAYEERLIQFAREYAPQQVPLIAICPNDAKQYPQDSFENMKVRVEAKGFNFPYLHDEDQSVATAYGAERTPHAYVLQKGINGWEVVYQGSWDDNYQDAANVTRKYVEETVQNLMEGKHKRIENTKPVGCSIKWKA